MIPEQQEACRVAKHTLAEEAVAPARQGLAVFPCGRSRKPLGSRYACKDATTDPNVVRTMFADHQRSVARQLAKRGSRRP